MCAEGHAKQRTFYRILEHLEQSLMTSEMADTF